MRRPLFAASACLALAAVAAPALAQPPADAPSSTTTTTTTTTTSNGVTTTDTAQSTTDAPPPPAYAPPPPPADAYPAPPPPAPAYAPPPPGDRGAGIRIGTLSCSAAGGWGLLIGSRRPISCIYQGTHGVQHYDGDITTVGVDVGYHGKGAVVWTVIAPTDDMAPGSLAGHYGGVTASASAVVGVGANLLVGGNNSGVSLQPLSVEGNTGLAASAGIGGLDLTYTGVTR